MTSVSKLAGAILAHRPAGIQPLARRARLG
jgi:hypothetical protein